MRARLKPHVSRGVLYACILGAALGLLGVAAPLFTPVPTSSYLAEAVICVGVLLGLPVGWLTVRWGMPAGRRAALRDGALAGGLGLLSAGGITTLLSALVGVIQLAIGSQSLLFFGLTYEATCIANMVIQPLLAAVFGAIGGLLSVSMPAAHPAADH